MHSCLRAQFFGFPMPWIAGQSRCMKEVQATPDKSYMAGYSAGTVLSFYVIYFY